MEKANTTAKHALQKKLAIFSAFFNFLSASAFASFTFFSASSLSLADAAFFSARVLTFLVTIIVFRGLFALIYGLVFNRTTRQGIHDLVAGTYVIDAPPDLNTEMPKIPKVHQRITYGLLGIGLLIGIASFIFQQNQPTLNILETGEWEEIEELQSTLMESNEFFSVSVHRVNRGSLGSSTILKDLNIEVWLKTSCTHDPDY